MILEIGVQRAVKGIDPQEKIFSRLPHHLSGYLPIIELLAVKVIQGTDSRNVRMKKIAEQRHKYRVPEENIIIKRGVHEIAHKPAALCRTVYVGI